MQPVTSNTKNPSVVVVGSGIAGLAAAQALLNADFKVTVLESRDRIGGRICTNYDYGYPIDMGASWLHGASEVNPLASIIGQLHLPLHKTSDDNSVLFDHDLKSYALFDSDGKQVPASLVSYVGTIFEELLEEVRKLRTEFNEDISIQKAFTIIYERQPDRRLEGLAQRVIQWYICRLEGWFAADADNISSSFWDEEELLAGGHAIMINGYSPVTSSLAKGLDLRLNHRVTKVFRNFYGVNVMTADGSVFKADAVIICVPLGVLKAKLINFEPKLPAWKEAAINDIGVGKENKIALLFKNMCWPNVEFIGIVAPTTYGCSYFLNLHKATGHPVLVYMPSGRLADDIEKMSNDAAARFATTLLKRIFPDMPEPEQYLVTHWGSDIDTLGAYSYCAVGKPPDLHERLRVPVENVFFAGEATSMKFPGTVHGAYASGLQAAQDCRRRFAEQRNTEIELFRPVMAEDATEMPTRISLKISPRL